MKQEWIIAYDITENDLREKTAQACKNYGLERIQYSVFHGKLSKNRIEELALKLKELTLHNNASIYFIPTCESCVKKQIIIQNKEPTEKQSSKKETQANIPREKNNENKSDSEKTITTDKEPTKKQETPTVTISTETQQPQDINQLKEHTNEPPKTTKPKEKEKEKAQEKKPKKKRTSTIYPLDEIRDHKKEKVIFW